MVRLSGRLLLLLTALAVAACAGGAAEPVAPPTGPAPVIPAASGDERRAVADAVLLAVRGRHAEVLALLEPFAERDVWYVPTHVLRQDAMAATAGPAAVTAWYAPRAAERPGDAIRALLAARALPAGTRSDAYRAALDLDPASPWTRIAMAADATDRAVRLTRRGTELADAGYEADAATVGGEADADATEAVQRARGVVADHPEIAQGHAVLAEALLTLRSLRGALPSAPATEIAAAARRAAELEPWDPRHLVRLARALRVASDDAGAEAALVRALALVPGDRVMLAGLGRVRLDLGNAKGAAEALEEAARGGIADATLLMNLGVARFRLGDTAGAIDALAAARKEAPKDPRVLENLAWAYGAAGRHEDAAEAIQAYIDCGGPDRESARTFLAKTRAKIDADGGR